MSRSLLARPHGSCTARLTTSVRSSGPASSDSGPAAATRVHRPQVEQLARRSGVDSRDSPIPFGPVGRVPTSDAARILGLSKQETRALAAAGLIPAVRDHRGSYWYRADQITLVARARHARANRVISRRAGGSGPRSVPRIVVNHAVAGCR